MHAAATATSNPAVVLLATIISVNVLGVATTTGISSKFLSKAISVVVPATATLC